MAVPPPVLKKLQKYIKDPAMHPDAVGRVSSAAKTLAIWVHAVDIFSRVAKEVEPKKARVAEMNAKLASANAILKEKQDTLQAVLEAPAGGNAFALLRVHPDRLVLQGHGAVTSRELGLAV